MKGSSRRSQRGASIWMVITVVVILAFGAIFGLKLIPVYLEYWKIERAIDNALEGAGAQSKREIREAILRRLDIDEVRRIDHKNFGDFLTINKKGTSVSVDIDYERVEKLVGNIYILAAFQKTVSPGG